MKQKDIAMILIVVFVAGIASFFISKLLFTGGTNRNLEVEIVQPITAEFDPGDERYAKFFNEQALNPTSLIRIGDTDNKKPF